LITDLTIGFSWGNLKRVGSSIFEVFFVFWRYIMNKRKILVALSAALVASSFSMSASAGRGTSLEDILDLTNITSYAVTDVDLSVGGHHGVELESLPITTISASNIVDNSAEINANVRISSEGEINIGTNRVNGDVDVHVRAEDPAVTVTVNLDNTSTWNLTAVGAYNAGDITVNPGKTELSTVSGNLEVSYLNVEEHHEDLTRIRGELNYNSVNLEVPQSVAAFNVAYNTGEISASVNIRSDEEINIKQLNINATAIGAYNMGSITIGHSH